jgi:hypothetical protein
MRRDGTPGNEPFALNAVLNLRERREPGDHLAFFARNCAAL